MRIITGQLNFWVGDIKRNLTTMQTAAEVAKKAHADLLVFPELALSGYPPEDLLFRPEFHEKIQAALSQLVNISYGIDILLGYPEQHGKLLYNAAIWFREGRVLAHYRKQRLPNYSVFDEARYFSEGETPCVVELKGARVGVLICEDIWYPEPVAATVAAGAQLIICLNSSPFHMNKVYQRAEVIRARIKEHSIPLLYAHGVGGQDELIFDGGTMLFDAKGELCQRAPLFKEQLVMSDFTVNQEVTPIKSEIAVMPTELESAYEALVLGVHDYVKKNGFSQVLIGLSGGIDSALVAAIAVDALGADAVKVVALPSRYSAPMSLRDAKKEARLLGVECIQLSIEPALKAFLKILKNFTQDATGIVAQNIQARCRGMILMALSNQMNSLVLVTGNKSEMAMGYSTLYGDMAGGLDVLKDVSKTLVYQLARYRNERSEVIPERVFIRPPSAELAPDQRDEDTLPPYDLLDPMLARYVEQHASRQDLVNAGFPSFFVDLVISRIHQYEYKRRQASPGIRITPLAFGRDWRYPVTSGFLR
jgi:NAD+ synthase (glutamine-hydrolysing)